MIILKIDGTADDLPEIIKTLAGFRIIEATTTYKKGEQVDDTPQGRARRAVEIARRRAHGLDTPPPIG